MLAVLCALSVLTLGVMCEDPPRIWTMQDYPNPYKHDKMCMRQDRNSSVCDPNGILEFKEANQLDSDIRVLMDGTECPCSSEACRRDNKGYRVSVALMEEMYDGTEEKRSEEEKMEWSLDEAHAFAHVLLNEWSAGQCKEDILILYSQKNNVVYTVTNKVARKTLTNNQVGAITVQVKGKLSKGGDVYLGLKQMLTMYKQVFNNDYKLHSINVNKPLDPQAQIGGGQAKHGLYCPLLLASLTVILMLIRW